MNASVLLGNGDGTFQAAVNYGGSSFFFPVSVAVGDFNVDGKADLACSHASYSWGSVQLGNGDGTFQAPLWYPSEYNSHFTAVGDLNNDGRPDLAVANAEGNVSVLLGNGDGTFQPRVNYATGSSSECVALGDFNGDGTLDLAVGNFGADSVSVLLGNGNGTFLAGLTTYGAGKSPNSLAVGDFDGDRILDLAVATRGTTSLSVLIGNGDGTLQGGLSFPAGPYPISVVEGDFNGDGNSDVAVANRVSPGTVTVLLGNGNGTVQAPVSYAVGSNPRGMTASDLNHDGILDLAVPNEGSHNLSVLLGNGDGTFQAPDAYASGSSAHSVAVGDFNNDGKPDLAVTNHLSSGTVSILLGKVCNSPPVAEAGSDQAVHPGNIVNLDGSGSSDPDGDYPLTYSWQIVSSPPDSAAELLNAGMVNPAFVPDRMGDYLIQLIVTDSKGRESPPDTVVISTCNTAPVAAAGPDQALLVRYTTVQLNGTQSYDDEGDSFFHEWAFVHKPDGSQAVLSDAASAAPTFVADLYGDYVIRLTVIDIFGAVSEPDEVTVSFTNVKPVANAGANQAVVVGQKVILDGSASSDANGDPLTFNWSFVSKPPDSQAALAAPEAVQTTFQPDLPGTYVLSLVVDDGLINSDPSNMTVEVITRQDAIAAKLLELIARINALPDDSFKNSNMRHSLTSKVNAALSMLENQGYAAVLSKLENDLLPKTDGCALDGAPDANDWITNCASQAQIYPLIVEIIEMLWSLH
jgi:hypothetical protein